MKKEIRYILLFAFLLFCGNAYSQARLGSSLSQIRSEFSADQYQFKTGHLNDGTLYANVTMSDRTIIYYFDSDYDCSATAIIPDNQGVLNGMVENYNKQYVIVSSTAWRMYSNEGICDISLQYPSDGGYYFLWTPHHDD